jgi:hypothetical protein
MTRKRHRESRRLKIAGEGQRRKGEIRYSVVMVAGATIVVDVEADSPDTARERAREEAYASLCHKCANDVTLGDEWEPVQVTAAAS